MPNYPYNPLATPLDLNNLSKLNANYSKIQADITSVDSSSKQRDNALQEKITAQQIKLNNIVQEVSNEAFELVVDSAKLIWKTPVNAFADLTSTYPEPQLGWTVMVRETGRIYRWDTAEWLEIQDIDPTSINAVETKFDFAIDEKTKNLAGRGVNIMFPPAPLIPAKDDGSDNTAIVQAIIDNYGSIYVPDGKLFKLSDSIYLKSNMAIRGKGTFYTEEGAINNGKNLVVAIEKSNLLIDGVSVEGNIFGEDFPPEGYFDGMGVPILLIGCTNFAIVNTYTSKGGGYISGENQGVANIYLSSCKDGVVTNNVTEYCQNGIVVDDWYSKLPDKESLFTQNVVVSNNAINDGNGRGVVIDVDANNQYVNAITVVGNAIRNMSWSGIDLKGCSNSVVSGNVIDCQAFQRTSGATVDVPTLHGIIVDFYTRDSVIYGNTVSGAYRNGILLSKPNNMIVQANVIKMNYSNDVSPNNIYVNADSTVTLNNLKIKDNIFENTGVNAGAGNCIAIDLSGATSKMTLQVSGNTFKGKNKGIYLYGADRFATVDIESNTFEDDETYTLSAIVADAVTDLKISSNVAKNIASFALVGKASNLIFSKNILSTITTPYRFTGSIRNLLVSDYYVGGTGTHIFNTTGSSIVNSDADGMKFNDVDYAKIKNGVHPRGFNLRAGGNINVGYWASGDRNLLTPTSGGFIGEVCVSSGTPGTWRGYGSIS